MMRSEQPAGASMKLAIGLFLLAVLATGAASVAIAVWDGRIGHHGATMQPIHYDTNYDLSAQRRLPLE
jgi:hypothetical protein